MIYYTAGRLTMQYWLEAGQERFLSLLTFLVFCTHWLILKSIISQSWPDTAIRLTSLVSICRAGQYLFYRQFISAKKEGGIIFSCGLLIFTSRTYIKHTHYLPGGGGGGGGCYLHLSKAIWGRLCWDLTYVNWYILRQHNRGNLRDLQHEGKEVT